MTQTKAPQHLLMFCRNTDNAVISFWEVGGTLAAEVDATGYTGPSLDHMLGRHAIVTLDSDFTPTIKAWIPLHDTEILNAMGQPPRTMIAAAHRRLASLKAASRNVFGPKFDPIEPVRDIDFDQDGWFVRYHTLGGTTRTVHVLLPSKVPLSEAANYARIALATQHHVKNVRITHLSRYLNATPGRLKSLKDSCSHAPDPIEFRSARK